ncbi:hypothetical protein V6C27_02795 [Peptococcaceae bacterium 1198_IL3148]
MKPQPPGWIDSFGFSFFTPGGHISGRGYCESEGPGEKFFKLPCQVGDILWVRETWCIDDLTPDDIYYRADYTDREAKELFGDTGLYWRPSIHMPRKVARLFLRVTNVRVERLQDITEGDARVEGFRDSFDLLSDTFYPCGYHFVETWDSIYAKQGYSWDANPWVWVIEFERVKGNV